MAHLCDEQMLVPDGRGLYWCSQCGLSFQHSTKKYMCFACRIYYMTWPEKQEHGNTVHPRPKGIQG